MTRPLFCLALIFKCSLLSAQFAFVNKGALIKFNAGLDVVVNGDFRNDSAGVIGQSGNLHVLGDLENDGLLNFDGNIHLQGNWLNNASFNADTLSYLALSGGIQLISGVVSSKFGILELAGSGSKFLSIDTKTHSLNLTDRELQTDSFSLTVESANPAALMRSTGYVFSRQGGRLIRNMQSGDNYLFPTGTSSHYRPVSLAVSAASVSTGVRYAEVDAGTEGLPRSFADSSICRTNSEFYYILSDSVAAGTNVSGYMDSTLLANWSGIATRPVSGNAIWRQHTPLETLLVNDSVFYKINILQTGNRALLLNRRRPETPVISGLEELCRLSSGNAYTAEFSAPNQLLWNVSSGVLSSTSGNPVYITWGQDSTGLVSVIQTDDAGCSSYPANLLVQLNPVPTAAFDIQAPELPFEDELFEFRSTGSGATNYRWIIAEEFVSTDSLFNKSFSAPGNYLVNLIVTNEFGCNDTAQQSIEVLEGIIFPNAFSPDGDGINDYLVFQNSGILQLGLDIFNRWGVKVFETEASKVNWDGRTSAGELVSPGTYFYVLKAKSALNTYEKRGSVTVFH